MCRLTINEYGSVIDSSGKTLLLSGVAIPCGNADKQAALNTKDMVERYNAHDKLTADKAALVEENQSLRDELEALKADLDKNLCKGYEVKGSDKAPNYHIKRITISELNKIKADTIKEVAEANKCELNIPSYPEDVVVCYFDDLMDDANKLGQDND